jgi:hypothetical protein
VVDNAGKVDFTTASIAEIEALFKSYGEVGYDVHSGLTKWLVTDEHNDVFAYLLSKLRLLVYKRHYSITQWHYKKLPTSDLNLELSTHSMTQWSVRTAIVLVISHTCDLFFHYRLGIALKLRKDLAVSILPHLLACRALLRPSRRRLHTWKLIPSMR